MSKLALRIWFFCVCLPATAVAQTAGDPGAWLARISNASQKLNYAGTFTYQSGKHVETSRIVHVLDASGEYEKLETLDGMPREVIRNNAEVRCFLPEQKTVIVDKQAGRGGFPARLPSTTQELAEHYRIRQGERVRVAGLEAQQILLEPRDDYRYGQIFWADLNTGLLLKSRTVNDRGETMEQLAFTEIRIGQPVDREKLKPRYLKTADWRVVNARGSDVRPEDSGWNFRSTLPGFRQVVSVRRQLKQAGASAYHVVFSDGLASISVFIEPLDGHADPAHQSGLSSSGAMNIYRRAVGNHLLTVLGEVPSQALVKLAEGVEQRKP
ncbi:MAG: siderophore-interacting protein [Zoogloea sp.]|nr:siderophore-interacting protein [Zoogloea sp.]